MEEKLKGLSFPQIFWSSAIAIIVWTAIGFSWFGPGFNWATQNTSQNMATTAVTERLASICAAQALAAPNAETSLKELADLSSWKQKKYIEEAKWATMPGSDSPESGVSQLCADKLLAS